MDRTVTILALAALLVAAIIEVLVDVPLPAGAYITLGLVFGVPLLMGLRRQGISAARLTLRALFFLALATLYFMPWSSRKPFLQDLGRIKTGMTVAQVERIMHGYLRGPGRKWQVPPPLQGEETDLAYDYSDNSRLQALMNQNGRGLRFSGNITYRHSKQAAFDSDWGVVMLRNGRVVSVRFLAD